MEPLFQIGKWALFKYTALMDLGILAGLALFLWLTRRHAGTDEAINVALSSLAGGILLGRLVYVLANLEYFSERWMDALRVWKGGVAFSGALLGGLAACFIYTRLKGLKFWPLLDAAAPALALGQTLGWLACHTGGRAYGKSWAGFPASFLPDIYGMKAYRFPVQMTAALWSAVVLLVLVWMLSRPPRPGGLFLTYLLLYLPVDFALRFLRGDVTPVLGPLEWGQLAEIILVLLFAMLLCRRRLCRR